MEKIETVRERSLARLEEKPSRSKNEVSGSVLAERPVQRAGVVERGYNLAITRLQETAPTAGETADYLDRVAAEIYSKSRLWARRRRRDVVLRRD